jgi:pimeloyl-ACP methyl ester carboxylesterase
MPAIRHRTIRVANVNVFVREAGESDRPPLVLLHGFPSSSRQYVRLMDRLAGRWHVIAPDYPGFGLSDPLPAAPPSTASPRSPAVPSTHSASASTPCMRSTSAHRSGSASRWPTTSGYAR